MFDLVIGSLKVTLVLAIIIIIGIPAGGVGRRLAGGWFPLPGGTTAGRILQGALAAAFVFALTLGTAHWHWLVGAGVLTFIGATWGFPRYSARWPFIDFRQSHMVPENLVDTIGLSLNGVIASAPLAVGAWWVGLDWGWLLATGALRGPAFWLAAARLPLWRWAGFEKWVEEPVPRWVPMPTALTEVYAGAALHLGIALAILL